MTQAEKDAVGNAYFEEQEASDGAGQLRAMKGEVTDADRELMAPKGLMVLR
jgi:hypothetical protein